MKQVRRPAIKFLFRNLSGEKRDEPRRCFEGKAVCFASLPSVKFFIMYAKQLFSLAFFFALSLQHSLSQQVLVDSVFIVEKQFYDLPDADRNGDSSVQSFLDVLESLQHNTSGQLRQLSPGGLATFLYRGYSARHMPIMWHGFNIQSITNGTFDLSLLPDFAFRKTIFHDDVQSTLVGNNVFSGGFVMDTKSLKSPKFYAEADYSSLENIGFSSALHLKSKKTVYDIGFSQRYDKNIFNYDSSGQLVTRFPTNFSNTNITGSIGHQFSKSFAAGADIWWQNSDRNILNDTIFIIGKPEQKDKNLKTNAHLTYQWSKALIKWNAVFSKENLDYNDFAESFPTVSTAKVTALQNTLQFYEKEFSPLHFYLRHRYDVAETSFFEDKKTRSTLQIGGSWFTEWPHDGKFQISGRQDLVDGEFFIPSFRIDAGHYGYMLHVYNNYQLPNFNDLYFPFGGNPDLKPESSINLEINKTFKWKNRTLKAELFAYWINNLIQWIPTDSTGWVWSPFNQEFVFSRGMQLDYRENIALKKSRIYYSVSYGLTMAEIRKHETIKSIEGKQIIYMPRHKARADVGYSLGKHHFNISGEWTGARYLVADNTSSLPSFLLLHAGYNFTYKNISARLDVYNISNEKYQLVHGFPLPGTNARLTLRYSLK